MRKQQRHGIGQLGDPLHAGLFRAVAEQADTIAVFLQPLVDCGDLRLAQFRPRNVETAGIVCQPRQFLCMNAHEQTPCTRFVLRY